MCLSLGFVADVARRMDEIPRLRLERRACAVFAANWPAAGGCAINVTVTYSVFAPILWRTGDRSDAREAVG